MGAPNGSSVASNINIPPEQISVSEACTEVKDGQPPNTQISMGSPQVIPPVVVGSKQISLLGSIVYPVKPPPEMTIDQSPFGSTSRFNRLNGTGDKSLIKAISKVNGPCVTPSGCTTERLTFPLPCKLIPKSPL